MKNTDKNTVQNAWNAFEMSGRVEDYLRYAKTNIRVGGETASADADRGPAKNMILSIIRINFSFM